MKLQQATQIANDIIHTLRPDCVHIQLAGSIRRQVPQVKDVEIVYISKTTPLQMHLFNQPTTTYFHADDAIAALIIHGLLAKDTTVKRWGPKYKRAIHCTSGIIIELFRAEPRNWGYIFALRTGPAAFNKLLVTKRAQGGALPPHITLQGGYVWDNQPLIPTIIPILTEHAFFALLDLPLIPPQDRTVERLRRCIENRRNQ